ncbi:MAG: transposase [Clostridia bacterium]|nr:transposase [Clostridia bacterium]
MDKYIKQLSGFYKNASVDSYVIMPNHIHLILVVMDSGASGTSHSSRQHSFVSWFVSSFKRFCDKEFGENVWQRGFFDHIIRNRHDYDEHIKYICDNPDHWLYDDFYVE